MKITLNKKLNSFLNIKLLINQRNMTARYSRIQPDGSPILYIELTIL